MTTNHRAAFWHGPSRRQADIAMRLYWTVVTIISLALLAATINAVTPRDLADVVRSQAISTPDR